MSDLLRRRWRATVAVGFLLLSFLATAQQDPANAGRPQDGLQVLECFIAQRLPAPPAVARDGGFGFEFESLGGTAVDGRACTVYRLRNLPGSPPTPVRWAAGSEVLVGVVGLRRCEGAPECDWFEVARYFDGDVVDGETIVSFGLNADSFRVQSPGLVAFAGPNVTATAASVGTEVVGTTVTPDGDEVSVDIVVKSRYERRGEGVTLIYEVTADDPAQLDGSDFVLEWQAFDLLATLPTVDEGLASPFRSLATGDVVPATHAGDGTVSVRLESSSAVFRDLLVLTVREAGDDGEVLFSVPLPAFVPGPG